MNLQQNKPSFESTLKSAETEEFIDLHFYRPIGYRWALLFNKWGITPNQITILSIIIGMAAGVCFYFTGFWFNLLGVFLLIWANSYDSADGQLARMTHQKTELGRILDGAASYFWFGAIYSAIIFRSWEAWGIWIFLLALFSGYSHGKQSAMADYYRNLHLLFLKGKTNSELDNSSELKEKYKNTRWKEKPLVKFFEKMYLVYTEGQENWSVKLQKMLQIINTQYAGKTPEWLPEAFCKKSFPLLKYTNMLSFNMRSIALFVCVLSGFPFAYFLFEISVMNIILIYTVRQYGNICKELAGRLIRPDYSFRSLNS
ncbi:hypothetical protein AGMMS50239_13460 [Bacteroidia bacterium]|nr:hypothetical protein AGMMS50239_13460 [Bacteroidia bacterium]